MEIKHEKHEEHEEQKLKIKVENGDNQIDKYNFEDTEKNKLPIKDVLKTYCLPEEMVIDGEVQFKLDHEILEQKIKLFCDSQDKAKWTKTLTTSGVDIQFKIINQTNSLYLSFNLDIFNFQELINSRYKSILIHS